MESSLCIRTKFCDYMLILGVLCAPMNALRIGKVGPSEVVLFLWCLLNIKYFLRLRFDNLFVLFLLSFFILIVMGSCIGALYYSSELNVFDIFAYLYFFTLSITIYYFFRANGIEYIKFVIDKISIASTIFYSILYVWYFLVSRTFFGFSIFYFDSRFAPLSLNPHQFAGFSAPIIIFLIYRFFRNGNRPLDAFLVIQMTFIAMMTKSSTLILSLFLTFLLWCYSSLSNISKDKRKTLILVIVNTSLALLFFIVIGYDFLIAFIEHDANGMGRLQIFSSATALLKKNIIFGIGPGIHGVFNGENIEFHNTYLEILAMSGIVGLSLYVFVIVKMFLLGLKKTPLIYMILPLHLFGFSGFAMRRSIFWFVFSTIFAIISIECSNDRKNIRNTII